MWCLLWALASKLFQHRFDFWPHLAVAVRGAAGDRGGGLRAAVASRGAQRLGRPVAHRRPARAAGRRLATLLAHASLVLPHARRALAVAAAAAFAPVRPSCWRSTSSATNAGSPRLYVGRAAAAGAACQACARPAPRRLRRSRDRTPAPAASRPRCATPKRVAAQPAKGDAEAD
ncbi:MAG: hypothetical protein MZW92_30820 [Comamonadaceae bacterium]|nr:hypothetical protein [Comamonadaceae bacterium]